MVHPPRRSPWGVAPMSADRERITLGVVLLVILWVLWRLVCRLRWHPWATVAAAGLVGLVVLIGLVETALVAFAVFLLLGYWRKWFPVSFDRHVTCRARTGLRFELVYSHRWSEAMSLFGLTAQVPTDRPSVGQRPARLARRRPEMVRLTSTPTADRLLVKHRLGHEQAHWDIRTAALAETFRAHSCRITPARPGYLWLTFRTRETLAPIVTPAPRRPAERIDFEALRVGITEDGDPWRLRLLYTHLLIGGATGSGKSELLWAIVDALAPAIAARLVQMPGIDPKGGMELTPGRALFSAYAYPSIDDDGTASAEPMVELAESVANLTVQRADVMRRAGVRKHVPTIDEPLIVLLIDELAYLTSYLPDPGLRKRALVALSTILTQGRAPGVVLIGAVQDVRKEAIPLRDLFPTRVALRTTEAAHADLILGEGAYKAGAVTDRIPERLPGVGYVRVDGQTTPMRVRSAHLTDTDVVTLAATYPAPTGLELIEDDGQGDEDTDDLGEAA